MIHDPDEEFFEEVDVRLRNIIRAAYDMGFADGLIVGDSGNISATRTYESGEDAANKVFAKLEKLNLDF
jgi:hypothetical protein